MSQRCMRMPLDAAGLRPFWTEPNLVYINIVRVALPELAEYTFINIRGNHDSSTRGSIEPKRLARYQLLFTFDVIRSFKLQAGAL
ncbi:hypothetical protein EDB83DRAFT_474598 [Lactarius deliciosus]|nr:hypothetical protein EDB83DRAFT_474598 [Lactarius deliciosus]